MAGDKSFVLEFEPSKIEHLGVKMNLISLQR